MRNPTVACLALQLAVSPARHRQSFRREACMCYDGVFAVSVRKSHARWLCRGGSSAVLQVGILRIWVVTVSMRRMFPCNMSTPPLFRSFCNNAKGPPEHAHSSLDTACAGVGIVTCDRFMMIRWTSCNSVRCRAASTGCSTVQKPTKTLHDRCPGLQVCMKTKQRLVAASWSCSSTKAPLPGTFT